MSANCASHSGSLPACCTDRANANLELCRGLVACANANAPHTNGSQFFITLDRTDGLNKRNTIFGKVTGDTVYNLANMNELEVEEDDRCCN